MTKGAKIQIKSEAPESVSDTTNSYFEEAGCANSNKMGDRKLALLSLDGGGVRGVSSLHILRRIMLMIDPDNPPKPCEVFDIIGGTSTGGLIAIMLGRLQMSIDECLKAYHSLSNRVFRRAWWQLPFDWSFQLHERFSSSELEEAIKDIVFRCTGDESALMRVAPDEACKLFVCAKFVDDNATVRLSSYPSAIMPPVFDNIKIWEAARATSAAPSYFNPIKVGGNYQYSLMDGATGSNNPIKEVWAAAKELWAVGGVEADDASFEPSVGCIVSIGTGVPTKRAMSGPLHRIFETIASMVTQTEDTAEDFKAQHIALHRTGRYFRLSVPRELGDIQLSDHAKITEISQMTEKFLDSSKAQTILRPCADLLAALPRLSPAQPLSRRFNLRKHAERRPSYLPIFLFLSIIIAFVAWSFSASSEDCNEIDYRIPIIAIMGKTGVGKSSLIHALGGKSQCENAPPVIGHGLESMTTNLIWYKATVMGKPVYLIDTPGYDDSRKPDSEIMFDIQQQLLKHFQGDKLLKGIIYLHDISAPRIGGAGKESLRYMEKLLGSFRNVVLVTTRWSKEPTSEDRKMEANREQELREVHWKHMLKEGSEMMVYDGKNDAAQGIIINIILKPNFVDLTRGREFESEDKKDDEKSEEAASPSANLVWWRDWVFYIFATAAIFFVGSLLLACASGSGQR